MFHLSLPVDLIRHVYKLFLDENPLEIFNFNKEIFTFSSEENEKKELINYAMAKNYEITGVPLFENKLLNNFFNNENFLKNLDYLDLVENKNLLYFTTFRRNCENYIGKNIKTFKWLLNQPSFPFHHSFLEIPIAFKDLEMLEMFCSKIQDKECSWGKYYEKAILNKNFQALKYLRSQSHSHQWDIKYSHYAVLKNDFISLKWLCSQNPPCPLDEECCYIATVNGHFEILKFLYSKNLTLTKKIPKIYLYKGNEEIIKCIGQQLK